MQFAFTEDQLAITQAARDMLVETCTPPDLRKMLAETRPLDAARWQTICEMGLLGLLAPEAAGGIRTSFRAACASGSASPAPSPRIPRRC